MVGIELDGLQELIQATDTTRAQVLYRELSRFVSSRVRHLVRTRYADLLTVADQEDVVSEVLFLLLSRGLRGFRGSSRGELLAFVRTVTDRRLWRLAGQRIRARNAMAGAAGEEARSWAVSPDAPDQGIIAIPDTPLSDVDADYLLDLLQAGSQSNLARATGVSRAAVTQRLHRIRRRIEALSPDEQQTAEVWLRQSARRLEQLPSAAMRSCA